jgi:conjugative transfer region lipoprotein (TIGR03751 family)
MKIFKTYLQLTLTWISFFCFLPFLVTGCATAGKDALPQGGDMTMADIYKQETGLSLNNSTPNSDPSDKELSKARNMVLTLEKPVYTGYTAIGANTIKNLFKPLPNPEIGLYVFPHLVFLENESQPVPGYTTAFFLYQSNHFAIPEDG